MTDVHYENWEIIIGLEIHTQLNTRSKMFGREPYLFGAEPNEYIGVVSTGQPGALPVLNREAVIKAIRFGCAINATIAPVSRFDRKSYFYPDCPKNYQITQFDHPIIRGGVIIADVGETTHHFGVNRAHLEEDAGMLKHFSSFSGVDFNRSGVPLLEIVSEPCLRSPSQAVAYATAVRAILEYVDASDCNMELGSFRMDANISVRPKGEQTYRPKTEIKNMNSFDHMAEALEIEIRRQICFYTEHPHERIAQGTYRFDPERSKLILMRAKESAEDYRYFPEPDLPPLVLPTGWIEEIRSTLPELPRNRYHRYIQQMQLAEQPARLLVNDKRLSDYFEEGVPSCANPRALANWLTVEFPGRLKELGKNLWDIGIPSKHVAELVNLIETGSLSGKMAKAVADAMLAQPGTPPSTLVQKNTDYQMLTDTSAIEACIDQVMREHEDAVRDYRQGKSKAFAFLVGQIMKTSRGKAPPQLVDELLKKKL